MPNNSINQLIGFCLIGLLNTTVDLTLFHWLAARRRWSPWQAHCCSGSVALLVSFVLNQHVVFRPAEGDAFQRFPRFLMVTLFSLYVIQPAVLFVGVGIGSWLSGASWARWLTRPDLRRDLAKVAAILAGLAWNFGWYKGFVFAAP